jgi:hypothetical protein
MADREVFACSFPGLSMELAMCGGPTEVEPEVGQEWMHVETGSILPVKQVREDYIDLGGERYTLVCTREMLWAERVLVPEPEPSNVVPLPDRNRKDAGE